MWPWGSWVQVPLLTPFFFQGEDNWMLITREDRDVKRAISILFSGGVLIYPAFTIYGFGAGLFDYYANKRIFALKKRDISKPFLIIAKEDFILRCATNVEKDRLIYLLKNTITVVVNVSFEFPFYVTLNGTVAFRLANTPFLDRICSKTPITSTSINVSGSRESLMDEKFIFKKYRKSVDGMVFGKVVGEQSTIVRLEGTRITVLRKGYNSEKVKEVL